MLLRNSLNMVEAFLLPTRSLYAIYHIIIFRTVIAQKFKFFRLKYLKCL